MISKELELDVCNVRLNRILELANETEALLYGQFTLASGKQSDHYYEGKRLTLHPEGSYLIGQEMLERLKGTGVESVGGLVIGAVPIVTSIALIGYKEGYPIPAFIVREEAKQPELYQKRQECGSGDLETFNFKLKI